MVSVPGSAAKESAVKPLKMADVMIEKKSKPERYRDVGETPQKKDQTR